jgi:hypothetical protein
VRVRYQNGLLSLPQPVTFVNNGQQLSAQGTFALDDSVDRVARRRNLGRQPHRARRAAALATPAGRARSPAMRASAARASTRNIVGNIKLLAGIVDGYAFQSLDTLVNYREGRAQVDAILIQSPTRGSTPRAASRSR